jgi:hypothetical protein
VVLSLGSTPSSATATLNARRNRWRTYGGSGTTDQTFINSRINGTYAAYVLADTVLTSDPSICGQSVPGAYLTPGEVALEDGSGGTTSSQDGDVSLPGELRFVGIAPNPMVSSTEVVYEVPKAVGSILDLSVFDVSGRLVRTLVHGQPVPGRFRATWTGEDCSGTRVSAGVYFLRMRAERFSDTKKVVLAR